MKNTQGKVREDQESFDMLMFKAKCSECEEEIALFDFESKTFYFQDVVPNYFG